MTPWATIALYAVLGLCAVVVALSAWLLWYLTQDP